MNEPEELAAVVGENARRLRIEGGATMESVVKYARHAGVKWTTARIVDLERGKLSPTLPMLLVLAHALKLATQNDVTLAALLQHDGMIRLNERTVLPGAVIERYVNGEPVFFSIRDQPEMVDRITRMLEGVEENLPSNLYLDEDYEGFLTSYGLGDERAAKSLGISKKDMMERAKDRWGHNLSTERDRRAGPDASAQKRGQITRTLLDELKKAHRGDG
ncbi:helix-turn-helix domain-containing protein [Arthrobacter sp. H41]|uniref:helix-turn-helix domain-containing protein n=1 Tax=Arthrobacter sp. H41 TaxID=1312978 RepID=UPI0012DF7507|nr:helix-turn-helix transcriptional regulator [Arthrobacter sp. H41]